MIITETSKLLTEAQEIDDFLQITISEDINEVVERGNAIQVYMARTGKMLADAKYHLNKKRKDDIMQVLQVIIPEKLSAKVQNSLIDSIAREEQYLVDWIERINRTCVHQLDWCRTLVSKAKEEMRLNYPIQ